MRYRLLRARVSFLSALLLILSLSHSGCFKGQDPTTYYGTIVVPHAQEFRWSDGVCRSSQAFEGSSGHKRAWIWGRGSQRSGATCATATCGCQLSGACGSSRVSSRKGRRGGHDEEVRTQGFDI